MSKLYVTFLVLGNSYFPLSDFRAGTPVEWVAGSDCHGPTLHLKMYASVRWRGLDGDRGVGRGAN